MEVDDAIISRALWSVEDQAEQLETSSVTNERQTAEAAEAAVADVADVVNARMHGDANAYLWAKHDRVTQLITSHRHGNTWFTWLAESSPGNDRRKKQHVWSWPRRHSGHLTTA